MLQEDFHSVIILGTDSSMSLSAIRALGKIRPKVFIHGISLDLNTSKRSRFSKYLRSHHYLEYTNNKDLIEKVIRCIKSTGAKILLPVDERHHLLVSEYKEELKEHIYLPPLSNIELIQQLIDKNRLAELLEKTGAPVARTFKPDTVPANGILEGDFFPCLLKPVDEISTSNKEIVKVDNQEELNTLNKNESIHKYIIQEYIPGYDIDCSLLAVDGTLKAYTIQKGLISRGYVYSTAVRFEHNKRVLEVVSSFIEKINYSGIAHLDFRMDERDGQPKLVDFNARYWSSMLGSNAAGVNFPELNCLEALGISYEMPSFDECIYLMGKSIFKKFDKNFTQSVTSSTPICTDLGYRVKDIFPEIVAYVEKFTNA